MQHLAGKQQQKPGPITQTALRHWIKAALVVSLVLPVTLSAAKLFEVYLRHFYIVQTIRLTIIEPDLHTRSASQLRQDVVARLRLQGIDILSAEHIDVSRYNALTQIHVQYADTLIMFGKELVTLHFEETFP